MPCASSSLSSYQQQQQSPLPPAKLVKRKSFGFIHLGRGFSGDRGGEYEVRGQTRSNDADDHEMNGSHKVEKRNRRQSLSHLLLDRDKENQGKDTDGVLEKEDHLKGKGKEGAHSLIGSVHPISGAEEGTRRQSALVVVSLVVLPHVSRRYRLHYLLL